ncbi:MAG TPA: histidine phosphatase family protein [Afifellaceae bacterium]|nr:histidine phosphatase family protein [Afifellaceae bacterium]
MTTLVFLVRHAVHDLVSRVLTGRAPGVALSEIGRRQAERLAERLSGEKIGAVYASPQERARQTAAPIGNRLGLEVRAAEAMDEIDFGAWTGQSFESLDADPNWALWNGKRSLARPPGGESVVEVQARAVRWLRRLPASRPGGGVAVVSHADVIRAALAYFLGMPIDNMTRLEVSPGSISLLAMDEADARVLYVNEAVAA